MKNPIILSGKSGTIFTILFTFFSISMATGNNLHMSVETDSSRGPYNEQANAQLEINTAIKNARYTSKHILLIFGANWCPWCRALHQLLETHAALSEFLKEHYEIVLVDIGRKDKNLNINKKYGNPIRFGIPVMVILDENGDYLTTQETGSLEIKDSEIKGHQPEKVMSFLKKWAHKLPKEE